MQKKVENNISKKHAKKKPELQKKRMQKGTWGIKLHV